MSKKPLNYSLGLTATSRRNIRNGAEFEAYFDISKLSGTDKIIKDSATTQQTVDLMKKIVLETLADTEKIAPKLKGNTLYQTCKNIWNFLYNNIQYKLDEDGMEQLRRPLRSWKDRKDGIDCDCFSIFAASILHKLNIPCHFIVVEIDGKGYYQHIYVHVPVKKVGYNPYNPLTYYTIDPVLDQFNIEPNGVTKKKNTMIPVQYLNGISNTDNSPIQKATFGNEIDMFEDLMFRGFSEKVAKLYILKTHLENTYDKLIAAGINKNSPIVQNIQLAITACSQKPELAVAMLNKLASKSNISGLNGLRDWYNDASDWVNKNIVKPVTDAAKDVVNKITDATGKVWTWTKEQLKKAWEFVKRYNPYSALARLGFLAAMRFNLYKVSSRARWGYLTAEQMKALGKDPKEAAQYQPLVKKLEHIFVDILAGKPDKLKANIMHKRNPLDGYTADVPELQPTAADIDGSETVTTKDLDDAKKYREEKALLVASGEMPADPDNPIDDYIQNNRKEVRLIDADGKERTFINTSGSDTIIVTTNGNTPTVTLENDPFANVGVTPGYSVVGNSTNSNAGYTAVNFGNAGLGDPVSLSVVSAAIVNALPYIGMAYAAAKSVGLLPNAPNFNINDYKNADGSINWDKAAKDGFTAAVQEWEKNNKKNDKPGNDKPGNDNPGNDNPGKKPNNNALMIGAAVAVAAAALLLIKK